jgi:hypothetical protein
MALPSITPPVSLTLFGTETRCVLFVFLPAKLLEGEAHPSHARWQGVNQRVRPELHGTCGVHTLPAPPCSGTLLVPWEVKCVLMTWWRAGCAGACCGAQEKLSPELVEEKARLLSEGFGHWTQEDFNNFVEGCARYGRNDIEQISKKVKKPVDAVLAYAKVRQVQPLGCCCCCC